MWIIYSQYESFLNVNFANQKLGIIEHLFFIVLFPKWFKMGVLGERANTLLRLNIFHPDYFPEELHNCPPLLTVHKSTSVTVAGQLHIMSNYEINVRGQRQPLLVCSYISVSMIECENSLRCSLAFPMSFSVPWLLMSSVFYCSCCSVLPS